MSASDVKQKKTRRARRKFTQEFKDGAVKWVLDEGKDIPEVARDLDLTESALRTWVERAKEKRGEGRPGHCSWRRGRSLPGCERRTASCEWSESC